MTKAVASTANPAFKRQLNNALRVLRTAPMTAASPEKLPKLGAQEWVYMTVDAPGRVLEYEEANLRTGLRG